MPFSPGNNGSLDGAVWCSEFYPGEIRLPELKLFGHFLDDGNPPYALSTSKYDLQSGSPRPALWPLGSTDEPYGDVSLRASDVRRWAVLSPGDTAQALTHRASFWAVNIFLPSAGNAPLLLLQAVLLLLRLSLIPAPVLGRMQ